MYLSKIGEPQGLAKKYPPLRMLRRTRPYFRRGPHHRWGRRSKVQKNPTYARICGIFSCLLLFLAQEGLDEGIEFGVLLPIEFGCAGTQFLLERRFRVGFLELGIETSSIVLQLESEFGYLRAFFGRHRSKFFVGVSLGTDDFGRHTADFAERAHVSEFGTSRGWAIL